MSYTYENESNLMKDGDYEAIIERIERKTLPSGKEKLSVMYRIRADVEGQLYGNKCVFEDIWKQKDGDKFNPRRINQLLGTQHPKEGTVYETINDVIKALEGKPIVIHIVTVFDDYRGSDVNTISYYKSSNHLPKTIGKPTLQSFDDDGDIPF